MTRYIDTHTHVNLSTFDADREAVLARAKDAGVAVVNVGTKYSTSVCAVDIAALYDHAYAIVGLHPIQTVSGLHDEDEVGEGGKPFVSKGEVFNTEAYRVLASHKKVIAIGECGLDYFHTTPESERAQREAFIAQIHLANELHKPLMLHTRNGNDTTRNAYRDVAEILKSEAKVGGNAHFFAGSVDDARLFLEMGFSLSFTGVVTFSSDYDEVVRYVPKDMIHAETDAPYVAPKPYRGQRNEPAYVVDVLKHLALVRGVAEDAFCVQLQDNFNNLYVRKY
jgi:TatD DNase family protein